MREVMERFDSHKRRFGESRLGMRDMFIDLPNLSPLGNLNIGDKVEAGGLRIKQ
jgi:hypothetical protein